MDKRGKILAVATQLFAENGFEKTAISAICVKSNPKKGV